MAANTVPPSPANAPDVQVLYVFLHGLISLVDIGTGFLAFALDMQDQHRYLFGNWLTEDEIPARSKKGQPFTAELVGVDAGKALLDSDQNVIVEIDKVPKPDHKDVRAVFKLPRPAVIHHFIPGNLAANGLKGKGKVQGKPVALSSIRIFEYTFSGDPKQVQLIPAPGAEFLWQCEGLQPVNGTNKRVGVLHIYDQPGTDMNKAHNINEFNKSAVFLGTDLSLKAAVAVTPTTSAAVAAKLPPGLILAETGCLSHREEEVFEILAPLRRNSGSPSVGTGGCPGSGGVCAGCNAVLVS
jgi:hypothetical protein